MSEDLGGIAEAFASSVVSSAEALWKVYCRQALLQKRDAQKCFAENGSQKVKCERCGVVLARLKV